MFYYLLLCVGEELINNSKTIYDIITNLLKSD